jgi:antirestriction protein ArdC
MKIPELRSKMTQAFILKIEEGVMPWRRKWRVNPPDSNGVSGRGYNGVNVFLLDFARLINGWESGSWYTFSSSMQALGYEREGRYWTWTGEGPNKKLGVRKGSVGTHVVYYSRVTKEDKHGDETSFPIWRVFTLFNREQIEGGDLLPNKGDDREPPKDFTKRDDIDAWALDVIPELKWGGDRAVTVNHSAVTMPLPGMFHTIDDYYAVLFHEAIHTTKRPGKLKRKLDYGTEELVAELGAAFLCRHFRINSSEDDHSSYIGSWLENMKKDPKYLWEAMGMANDAANFLLKEGGMLNEEEANTDSRVAVPG